ncbi:hypothetical protein PMZ80_010018 [Knufia obscura]|uniref:Myb-like DNA-binding domain-containing protein n=1 Tax=Knufia obscura TaxID=1635080 RepID=A0ABR0RBA2_9EURO|nr:hypothetical protein PMZ80_010018 [Knufia obscura]
MESTNDFLQSLQEYATVETPKEPTPHNHEPSIPKRPNSSDLPSHSSPATTAAPRPSRPARRPLPPLRERTAAWKELTRLREKQAKAAANWKEVAKDGGNQSKAAAAEGPKCYGGYQIRSYEKAMEDIAFLLLCIEEKEGKIDFHAVGKRFGVISKSAYRKYHQLKDAIDLDEVKKRKLEEKDERSTTRKSNVQKRQTGKLQDRETSTTMSAASASGELTRDGEHENSSADVHEGPVFKRVKVEEDGDEDSCVVVKAEVVEL